MSGKKVDTYQQFKERFGGSRAVEEKSESEISQSAFDNLEVRDDDDFNNENDEYSLNNDEDFQLSASLKKSVTPSLVTSSAMTEKQKQMLASQEKEQKEARIKELADQELQKMRDIIQSSSDSEEI